jgi:hypothetical protein
MFMTRPDYYRQLIRSEVAYNEDECWDRRKGLLTRQELKEYVTGDDGDKAPGPSSQAKGKGKDVGQ